MSFVSKNPQRLKTPEQCAAELSEVALELGLEEFATVLALMCVAQESDFWCPWNRADPSSENYPHDSESNDGRSVAYFQQQNGVAGESVTGRDNWWGPMSQRMDLKGSGREFLLRLTDNYMDAVNDPALASEFIANVQRCREDLRGAYAKHWDRAWQLVQGSSTEEGVHNVGWTGDPVWLEEVLRAALGDRLIVEPDWAECGTGGSMGDIWGVMVHHTANQDETPERIIGGRPDLPGPLAQILIKMNGKVHLCAVGPCNHGGIGAYPGLGANTANQRAIGIECCYPTMGPGGSFDPHEKWKDAQVVSLRDTVAAILKKLGYRGDRMIGHKDYASRPPNIKIDPSNMDVRGWLAGEVNKDIDGHVFPGEATGPQMPQSPVNPPQGAAVIEYYASCAYWEQLGWLTQTEALAVILDKLLGTKNAGKTGMSLSRPKDA